jgi:hypothetical protein
MNTPSKNIGNDRPINQGPKGQFDFPRLVAVMGLYAILGLFFIFINAVLNIDNSFPPASITIHSIWIAYGITIALIAFLLFMNRDKKPFTLVLLNMASVLGVIVFALLSLFISRYRISSYEDAIYARSGSSTLKTTGIQVVPNPPQQNVLLQKTPGK